MDLKKILGGALGVMGGPIGAIGGSLLSAYLENKASRKMQQAEQDYQQQLQDKQADVEAFAEQQRQEALSQRKDVANMQEWASNLAAAKDAATTGLSNVAMRDSQAMADEYGRRRADVAGQFFGPGGARTTELDRLRGIRESDLTAHAMPVTSQFSGAGVPGTPSSWANAYNVRSAELGLDVGERARLMSALSGRTQDAGMQNFKGMTGLKAIDADAGAMADAFKVDTGVAEQRLGDVSRKAAGEKARAMGDIAHGYNVAAVAPSAHADTSGLAKAEAGLAKAGMYGGILKSLTDAARYYKA